MWQGPPIGVAKTGNEVTGIPAYRCDHVVDSVPFGVGTTVLDGVGVEIVGNDGAVLLDGRPDAESSNAAKGIGDDLAGTNILVERPRSLAAKTGGPVDLGQIEVKANSMLDDGDLRTGLASQDLHVVGTIRTLDFAYLGNDGFDGRR